MIDRRTLLVTAAFGFVLAPAIAKAQTANTRHVGWLGAGLPLSSDEFRRRYSALELLGWVEGKNLVIERRYGRADLLSRWAEEFVRMKVNLIVADGTVAAQAAKKATTTVPIVMWAAADPVGAGLVESLASPGGNVTGYALLSPEVDAKRLQLLRELMPGIERIGELIDSNNPYLGATSKRLESAYRSLGMQPIFVDLAKAARLEDAVAEVDRRRGQALHVPYADTFNEDAMRRIMQAAQQYALPTVVDGDELLDAGGLLSYGVNDAEVARRGAAIVDKILRGAKPSELPIEQPTKFGLGINLKTAKILRIAIPQALLLRADRVVQ